MQQEEHSELRIDGVNPSDLKRNSFKAPEGYFDNLTPRVMDAVRASEENPVQSAANWQRFLFPAIGMAAVVLIAVFIFNPNKSDNLNFDQVLASMTIEELESFADFETEELLAYGLVTAEDVEIESAFTEDELLDYLLEEEELELNSIYEEIEI